MFHRRIWFILHGVAGGPDSPSQDAELVVARCQFMLNFQNAIFGRLLTGARRERRQATNVILSVVACEVHVDGAPWCPCRTYNTPEDTNQ